MTPDAAPVQKDIVLIGGGHSHVAVLRRFAMRPLPGVRLTVLARDVHTPYSGMLPGFIAGHYGFDDVHIDLGPLARFAGARLLRDEAIGLDLEQRRVLCRERPPVAFDLLSVNTGSTPGFDDVAGAEGRVVPVKPIAGFVAHWQRLSERLRAASGPARIGVVGAGAGGVEILLCVQHRLTRLLAEAGRSADHLRFHLLSGPDQILPDHNAGLRARFERVLAERGVEVHPGHRVVAVADGAVRCANGAVIALDEILWVTSARPAPWLGQSGLEVDDKGFVRVDETLRSLSHREVFAAGDVAAMEGHPRPKSGVFAVRQGPPLASNLRRAAQGLRLKRFVPQRKFLSIVTTGDQHAVASRGRWALEGDWVWRWKDWIDRRFVRTYNRLPEMAAGGGEAEAMRCGGCGAKVGAAVLDRVLARLGARPEGGGLDDAALIDVPPGKVLLQSVDFFRAFIDDPHLFGRIAANHGLSDIYAMGGQPHTALAIVTVPAGPEDKVEEQLFQMLAGAVAVLEEARAALVGGHTGEGAEAALGFAVSGLAEPGRLLRKAGMRPGERLILTKPLGTGTLLAADMRRRAKGRWIDGAIAAMVQSNREAAACLQRHGATACTDVTGFGLLGHLLEMAGPSGVDVGLELAGIPILDGALETAQAGFLSSLHPQNAAAAASVRADGAAGDPAWPLLFDPQTAGGLLASVPELRADACTRELHALGYGRAAIIGTARPRGNQPERVTLV
jgi:selenide, water dikinase